VAQGVGPDFKPQYCKKKKKKKCDERCDEMLFAFKRTEVLTHATHG
jgi:hypothetical protein